MKTLNLYDFIENLKMTNVPNTQLDIYRNGIILMQVFKSENVIKWGWELPNINQNGIVINLVFNKHKYNNAENYSRFRELEVYHLFVKKDLGGGDMYFLYNDNPSDKAAIFIGDLLHAVYRLENDEIEVFLNSYG